MRVIIAGSRSLTDPGLVARAMRESGFVPTVILSGTASGVDRAGEEWAQGNNIPIEKFPAAWGKYGRRAGMVRNVEMAEKADALVAIWDGKSPGTNHMILAARERGLLVHVFRPNPLRFSGSQG